MYNGANSTNTNLNQRLYRYMKRYKSLYKLLWFGLQEKLVEMKWCMPWLKIISISCYQCYNDVDQPSLWYVCAKAEC